MKKINLHPEIKKNSTQSAIDRFEELFGPLPLWTPNNIKKILNKFKYHDSIDLASIPDDLFFNA